MSSTVSASTAPTTLLTPRRVLLAGAVALALAGLATLGAATYVFHQQLDDTQAVLLQTQSDLTQSQTDLSSTRARFDQSQSDLSSTQASLAQSETDLSITQASLQQTQAERDGLNRQVSDLNVSMTATTDQLNMARQTVTDLNQQLSDATATGASAQANLQVARQETALVAQVLADYDDYAKLVELQMSDAVTANNWAADQVRDFNAGNIYGANSDWSNENFYIDRYNSRRPAVTSAAARIQQAAGSAMAFIQAHPELN